MSEMTNERIRSIMLDAGKLLGLTSKQALADFFHVSKHTLNNWVTGKSQMSMVTGIGVLTMLQHAAQMRSNIFVLFVLEQCYIGNCPSDEEFERVKDALTVAVSIGWDRSPGAIGRVMGPELYPRYCEFYKEHAYVQPRAVTQ